MAVSDINALPNLWYQPALSSAVAGHASGLNSDALGHVVTDIADIEQCIRIILETPRGSDPHVSGGLTTPLAAGYEVG